MTVKIIKKGHKTATCECKCVLAYEDSDVNNTWIRCPCCQSTVLVIHSTW